MGAVNVRCIVNDVDASIAFYTQRLGFTVDIHPAPGFARRTRLNELMLGFCGSQRDKGML